MTSRTIIHLVHGTWGRGFGTHFRESLALSKVTRPISNLFKNDQAPEWFEEGSDFRNAVVEHLEEKNISKDLYHFEPFEWSGSNSFTARDRASNEFIQHITNCIEEDVSARHLILAHSHGGTMAADALIRISQLKDTDIISKFDGALTLATPFVTFLRKKNASNYIAAYLFSIPFIIALFICSVLYYFASGQIFLAWWLSSITIGIILPVTAPIDFTPWNVGRFRNLLSQSRWVPYIVALFGAPITAWFGLEAFRLQSPAQDLSLAMQVLTSLVPSVMWMLSVIASLGSFFIILFALGAGKQSGEGAYKGIFRQFYITFPLFGIALVLLMASRDAFFASTPMASNFLVFGVFGSAILAAVVVALIYFNDGWFHEIVYLLSKKYRADTLPHLEFPLMALRLPRDEAELSIIAAQIAEMVPKVLERILIWPLSLIFSSQLRAIGVSVFLGCIHFLEFGIYTTLDWPLTAIVSLFAGFTVVYFGGLLYGLVGCLIYLLVKITSVAFVALAVGWESFFLGAYGTVECEPLPHVDSEADTKLKINWASVHNRPGEDDGEAKPIDPIRHSIYDYAPARSFIVEWLAERIKKQKKGTDV